MPEKIAPATKYGGKNGGMPARQDRGGKVHADNGVHGDDQGRGQPGQQQVNDFVAPPRPVRSVPAQAQQAHEAAIPAGPQAVAQRGRVRNQAHVPKRERDQEVGPNCEEVPHERRTEIDPQRPAPVRIGDDPVAQPRPSHVNNREQAGANHGKDRHGFGRAIDRSPPLLPKQKQDRRDQGPGMPDADPKDKVGDVEGPADGSIQPPGSDAHNKLVADRRHSQEENAEGQQECQPPQPAPAPLEGSANVRGHLGGRLVAGDPLRLRRERNASHAFGRLPPDDSARVRDSSPRAEC